MNIKFDRQPKNKHIQQADMAEGFFSSKELKEALNTHTIYVCGLL